MGHNSCSGSYRTTRELKMAAFDKLPADVRQALANAAFDYVPQPILTKLKRGSSAHSLIVLIDRWDKNRIVSDRRRIWRDDRETAGQMIELHPHPERREGLHHKGSWTGPRNR
jgi:hypothetical protein